MSTAVLKISSVAAFQCLTASFTRLMIVSPLNFADYLIGFPMTLKAPLHPLL